MSMSLLQLLGAMLIWGGAWAFGKYVANHGDLFFLISSRFFLSALALFLVVIVMGQSLRVGRKAVAISLVAAVAMSLYNTTFFLGLRYGLAGVGGVLVTTLNPIFTYFAISMYQRKRLPMRSYIGLFMGLLGGAVIMELWQKSWFELFASGNIFFLLCSLFWVGVSVTSKASERYLPNPVFSFYTYSFIFIIWFVVLSLYRPSSLFFVTDLPWDFWAAMLYLSVLSVGIGTTIYFLATRRLGVKVASSFIFLVPLGALLGSWLLLGEQPRITTLAGGALNLVAVYYLNHKGSSTY